MEQIEKMPEKIFATPRGSGTVSGIWVDVKMDDEERGEYEYIRADIAASKYGLSAPVTDEQSLLDEIDWELMQMEDYTHGKDGERITALRAKIAARKHSVTPVPNGDSEAQMMANYLELRRELSTPVMSEQEIKEEAEKAMNYLITECASSERAALINMMRDMRDDYLEKFSALPKQHTEKSDI